MVQDTSTYKKSFVTMVLLCRSKRQAEKARKFRRLHSDHVKGRQ